jgi:hypothetical protein
MRTKKQFLFILVFLSALLPLTLADADDAGLPSVQFLSCQGQCANFVPAKPLDIESPKFPSNQASWTRVFSEGAVKLLYTVGPDGKVRHDVLVLYLIGPRDFADKAIEKIRTWTFEPATSNGKPVAQSLTQSYVYGRDPEDRRMILRPLEVVQALKLVSQLKKPEEAPTKPEDVLKKVEEARAKLEDVLKNVPLTSSDREAVVLPLANMALTRGDYLEARRLALIVINGPTFAALQSGPWLTRIKADLMMGDIPDALFAFTSYQQRFNAFTPDSAMAKVIQTARANADVAPLLTVQAQIPAAEDGDVYSFLPYRRSFTFQKIEGSLQKFVLSCDQATMESDITPEAQWRIPDKWSRCSVYVRGTPGTKFLVVQPKE